MDPRSRKPETDKGYVPAASGPVSKLAQSTQRGRGRPLNRRKEPVQQQNNVQEQVTNKRPGIAQLEPKVYEPYITIPGRLPRSQVTEKVKKLYDSQNFQELLLEKGIDYSKPIKAWLPIEPFDNREYDERTPQDYVQIIKESGENLQGWGLQKDKHDPSVSQWKTVLINDYDQRKGVFIGTWQEEKQRVELCKVNLIFEYENPTKFADRVFFAHQNRIWAESLIRYNFYIENMPTEEVLQLDLRQRTRLIQKATAVAKMNKKVNPENSPHINEVNQEFARTMNKIIFDKHLKESGNDLISTNLTLPPPPPPKVVPDYAMITIPQNEYEIQFSNFCFNSLYIKEEIILSLERIREQCLITKDKQIFNTNFVKTMRLEEFRQVQSGAINQLALYLSAWKDNIQNVIQTSFADSAKGWLNIYETSKEVYEISKLKKYLIMVKLMMQDSMHTMTVNSCYNFVDAIKYHIPVKVQVKNPDLVFNEFELTDKQKEVDPEHAKNNPPLPLLAIDIIKGGEMFQYSTDIRNFIEKVKVIFEEGLNKIKTLNSIEEVVMEHLFKRQEQKSMLRVPVIPNEKPVDPTQEQKNNGELKDDNKWLWFLREDLIEMMEQAISPLNDYLATFAKYKEVMQINPEEYIQELGDEDEWTVETVREEILKQQQKRVQVVNDIPETIRVSCFEVHCKDVRNALSGQHQNFAQSLIELIAERTRNTNNKLLENFRQLQRDINKPPTNIEELTKVKELIARVPNEIEIMKQEIERNMTNFTILEEFKYKFGNDDHSKKWELFGFPKRTHELISSKSEELDKQKEVFRDQMIHEQEEFRENVEDLENIVKSFIQYTDINQYKEIADIVQRVNSRLEDCIQTANRFNNHERLFNMDITDYTAVNRCKKEFDPYSDLWLTIDKWYDRHQHWTNDAWEELNGRELEETVENSVKTISTVQRIFRAKDAKNIMNVVDKIKEDVDYFKQFARMAVALRKPGMTDRHWDAISEKMGIEVRPHPGFTLTTCINMGLKKEEEFLEEIGEKAYKEHLIETKLDEMEAAWENIEFEIHPAKGSDSFIIGGIEPIQNLLDEHIMQTQNFYFSAFKKPFEDRIEEWSHTLMLVQDVMEAWIKVQINWMYLHPIFDSRDIAKQLPSEAKKFREVNSKWRNLMKDAKATKNVIKLSKRDERLDELRHSHEVLEAVQKGLRDYLETKRSAFSRFYFLSDEELLSILSDTKDPTLIQHHIKKVFENIQKLGFNDDLTIFCMYSPEGEKVDFVKPIDPKDKNVELWMGELEMMMKTTVRWILKLSIDDYLKKDRNDWVLEHPGQCVLNGSQLHWTSEVEDAIINKGLPGVAEYHEKLDEQLIRTVSLVRGSLTKLQSKTLGALIVIDVHALDVIGRLVTNQVDNVEEFDWISQLRYYWEGEECWVKCIQTRFPYGYEYLGNSDRLVITTLTDKCYMTLMGALHLDLGGAPAGPAGTGKTESVKDLSKALAKQIVVFNCSDTMDYIMVGTFFKGLASAGAWACFDEFNRIYIEVLSVIAQQLQQLLEKKRQGDFEFEFERSVIRMQPTFSVFITMNPGYAGRTELPDNLKALFRSVAMMVPNYAVIGEIKLYSFGFVKSRDLAQKMVATFKLASEQLSSQDHYDYGMRAVSSVINAAGLIKRAEPELDEYKLLLRALRDVNVPKFLKDDLPLFENIIKDLFPGVERPYIERSPLDKAIENQCAKKNLQDTEQFVNKVFQLYDTIQVRHGLMIVGPTGGGKSSNMKVLAASISQLKKLPQFDQVFIHTLNPKSITIGQLYGKFDEVTHEWTDGILCNLIRYCVKDMQMPPYTNRHWVMFDGPVDAIWIENMNTVLDDNKKLCLNSGEIIPLTPYMTMMFEVSDLAVASPATVSRCGMVYMEPVALGLEPLVKSWLNTLPEKVKDFEGFLDKFNEMFEIYVYPLIRFVRKQLVEPVATMDNNLVQSCYKYLNCFLIDYNDSETKIVQPEEIQELFSYAENLFIYSVIWSIGVTTTSDGRKKFDKALRDIISQRQLEFPFPDDGSVYDWKFETSSKQYKMWVDTIPDKQVDNTLNFNEIVVPTMESIRIKYAYKTLLTNKYHILSPGPTGTGKSINASSLLTNEMPSNFQNIGITFSAKTSANQTQDLIDSKIQRRKNREYGPPAGKYFVIFVDDLNMPKKEIWGAQPPIELLRQWMDHGGWYNRKELIKIDIVDIVFLSAMGPPGGGRSEISTRLVRHFNLITYNNFGESDLRKIFSKILTSFLGPYEDEVKGTIQKLITATLEVYNSVEQSLLPTPNKSHYTFNLRDMASVFQGLCSSDPKSCGSLITMVKLWCHENYRVFGDRLVSDEDNQWLTDLLQSKVVEHFQLETSVVYDQERLIFCNFLNSYLPDDQRPYEEVKDMGLMMKVMNEYLDAYNERFPKKQMKLVIFLDACCHVARLTRILRQPQGNALLLGVGGSGRQSLTKLAAFVTETEVRQIEITKNYDMNNWRDDLKAFLMFAGMKNQRVIFLFVDTQIINDQMLEDINNILNTGDVPNIYKGEDWEDIESVGKPECQRKNLVLTEMNIMGQYLNRVKQNIRIVLAMSPIGEQFRSNLRQFPSLINCCTIDWFTDWPEEALISVANSQLTEEDLELGSQQDSIVLFFKKVHKSVEQSSIKFKNELRRYNYVTPTSYLELLRSFKKLLQEKRKEVELQRSRFDKGVQELKTAEIMVEEMQQNLERLQPQLAEEQAKGVIMMQQIQADTKDAEETQFYVAKDEAAAAEKTAEAEALQAQAQAELDEAMPALYKALDSLKSLKKDHFIEVKTFNIAPSGVLLTMEALCMFFDVSPIRKNDPNKIGAKIIDYWQPAKDQLLQNPQQLLDNLMNYDKESITEQLIQKIKPKVEDPNFEPSIVRRSSVACEAMCKWVHAMYKFYHINKEVEPIRIKVAELNAEVAQAQSQLNEARAKLKEVNDKIDALQQQYDEGIRKQEELANNIEKCQIQLESAGKLIGGLGGEKIRWTENVQQLSHKLTLLAGDCALSAGMVAYVGAFTGPYRKELESEWEQDLKDLRIIHSEGATMIDVLGDPVSLQIWNVAGLPSDPVSTENGIIIEKARRWPLMIDPQMQANKFIKNLGKERDEGIEYCKASDANLIRNLGQAVMNGKWFLVENVGQELDPSLEPILQQQVIREGAGYTIKIGEKSIEYNDKFRFFMTTTLPNPHYSPETCVKVTLLNFAITQEGLEEQMMAIVVAKENAQLQETKKNLITDKARMQFELKTIEDTILEKLSTNEGNILENQELIDTLSASKVTSTNLTAKVEEARITEIEIDKARESYRPVAYRAALLFFCILDLANVNPMYQYSLQWFIRLFEMGIDNSPSPGGFEERLQSLNDYFTYSLYQNVCRSLYEEHKLLFSFTLTIKILQGNNEIDPIELRFLLTGPSGSVHPPPNPTNWLNDNQWKTIFQEVHAIDQIEIFTGYQEYFLDNTDLFRKIFDSNDAHRIPLPGKWDSKLNEFQKLLHLRVLRPDKMIAAVMDWVTLKMERKFIIPPTFDLPVSYRDSQVETPLICVLSPGSDPISSIWRFAEEMGMIKKLESISLGQGQGDKASALIEDAKAKGGWVLLQNCHLMISWMPTLEKIVEDLDDSIHRDFRLWLTSTPSPHFPVSVLQNGVKMTIEPPTGLRANLLLSYTRIDEKEFESCKRSEEYKTLLFGFCFFHAIVQDRRKFGPIGWNTPYAFTNEDLQVTLQQLKLFLDVPDKPIPYKVLMILGAEINYGGRVTDEKDSRLIKTILNTYITPEIFDPDYKFSESGLYYAPNPGSKNSFVKYIEELPLDPSPEAFGLNQNAQITTAQNETLKLLTTILSMQPRASAQSGKSREEEISELATTIQQELPEKFDLEEVSIQYQPQYNESMNTVLTQEVIKYQRLLVKMESSLADIQRALVGRIVMSEDLENMSTSLFDNQVPSIWSDIGFLSLKPLSSWFDDLKARVKFLKGWIANGTPKVFWISGFFFPQAFLTGTLQNFARKHFIAIDQLSFDFNILDILEPDQIKDKPEDGCYVNGLWLEGARWDRENHCLASSLPKELYTPMPIIQFLPKANRETPETGIYECPVYKTLQRAGTLSTTGHSTNYVLPLEIPSKHSQSVWIKAGVALFLALRN